MHKCDFLIIGAGFAGSVLSERIANSHNKNVILIDKRSHIGGNAYDFYDENGVLIHKYGPHIFHTNDENVLDYLSGFTKWRKYEHIVKAFYNNDYYDIPINAKTIEKFYNTKFSNPDDVKSFLESIIPRVTEIKNSEDLLICTIGKDLYNAFFEKFTEKTWFKKPSELSASVCGRLKVKYNYDEKYFSDSYQFMPAEGYTKMFENILDSKNIKVFLNTYYKDFINQCDYKYLIFTGAIDEFYDYKFGKLPYRSLRTEFVNYKKSKHQDFPVINYTGDEKFSRTTEFKYLTGQESSSTTIGIEYPEKSGEKFYPILTNESNALYNQYKTLAAKEKNVIFAGRLGAFKYYNMDQVTAQALHIFNNLLK